MFSSQAEAAKQWNEILVESQFLSKMTNHADVHWRSYHQMRQIKLCDWMLSLTETMMHSTNQHGTTCWSDPKLLRKGKRRGLELRADWSDRESSRLTCITMAQSSDLARSDQRPYRNRSLCLLHACWQASFGKGWWRPPEAARWRAATLHSPLSTKSTWCWPRFQSHQSPSASLIGWRYSLCSHWLFPAAT